MSRITAIVLTAVWFNIGGLAWAGAWKAGLAKADITPSEPLWMAGYAARTRPAEGTLQRLWVKVLALEAAGGQPVVLVTSDLLGFPKPVADSICKRLETDFRLPRARVLLTSSHTHSGPVIGDSLPDIYPMEKQHWELTRRYTAWLEKVVVETAAQALSAMKPAKLSAGQGEAAFAVNRRNNREAEAPALTQSGARPKGPSDHSVPVLTVRALDGSLTAVVFGYACHNTTLDIYNWSGDYAGFAQAALEQNHPGTVAMFWAGCGADQNPIPRRSIALCEKYGNMLANAVEEVLKGSLQPIAPVLGAAFELVDLPFSKVPDEAELKAGLGATNYQARWSRRLLQEREQGAVFPTSYPYPVQVWRLGDYTWIGLGGEVVVDYALRFRSEFGPRVWVAGYSNDVMAYIPSERVRREGGYESGAMAVYGLAAEGWAAGIEDKIADCVRRLIARAKPQAAAPVRPRPSEAGAVLARRDFSRSAPAVR